MKALFLFFGLVAATPAGADIFVKAFERTSTEPNQRMAAVEGAMHELKGLDEMVRTGLIQTPHDCLPEHRSWCFDVLNGSEKSDFVVQEWGEWADGIDDADMPDFVLSHMKQAAERGFNLFTDRELQAAR